MLVNWDIKEELVGQTENIEIKRLTTELILASFNTHNIMSPVECKAKSLHFLRPANKYWLSVREHRLADRHSLCSAVALAVTYERPL